MTRPDSIVPKMKGMRHVKVFNVIDMVLLGLKESKIETAEKDLLMQFIGALRRAARLSAKTAMDSNWDEMGWLQLTCE